MVLQDTRLNTTGPEAATALAMDSAAATRERTAVLWLTSVSHAVDHFQQQFLSALYPVIMAELGFGYAQLGILTAARSLLASGMQVAFGFFAAFVRRSRLLGTGTLVAAFGTFLTGLAGSYAGLLGARGVFSLGSSAQHPVGASLLAGYFPSRPGTVLALNSSVANVGALLAPLSVGAFLALMGWRQAFLVLSLVSLAMGAAFFLLLRERPRTTASATSGCTRLAEGASSYLRVLRNRNMLVVALAMMVGAAGRGEGVNVTFIAPHLVNDLGLTVGMAGLALALQQAGGIVGPLGFGWLSDRSSRKRVVQASLAVSAIATWWLVTLGGDLVILLPGLLVYGALTYSRLTLTQALVADAVEDTDRDAAFSLFYFLAFVSGPLWTLVTGFLMEAVGFGVAFSVLGFSYLVGVGLLGLVREAPRPAQAASSSAVGSSSASGSTQSSSPRPARLSPPGPR